MLPTELFCKIFKLVSSGILQNFDLNFILKIYLDIFKALVKMDQIWTQQTSLEH